MKNTKLLMLCLTFFGINAKPANKYGGEKSTKKRKTTAKIAPTKNENDLESNVELVAKALEQILPVTILEYKKTSLADNKFANSFLNEEMHELKKDLKEIKGKALREKLEYEVDSMSTINDNNAKNFIKLKFLYKIVQLQLLLNSIKQIMITHSSNEKEGIKNVISYCSKRLELVISEIKKAKKNKIRMPNKLQAVINEAIGLNKKLEKKNAEDAFNLPLLLSYISELETELKYVEVTNHIETSKK